MATRAERRVPGETGARRLPGPTDDFIKESIDLQRLPILEQLAAFIVDVVDRRASVGSRRTQRELTTMRLKTPRGVFTVSATTLDADGGLCCRGKNRRRAGRDHERQQGDRATGIGTAAVPPAPAAPPSAPTTPAPAPTQTPAPKSTPAPTTAPSQASGPTATVAPTGANQFAAEAGAKARCPSATVVWVNTKLKVYHFAGTKNYGNTKAGAYMCETDATAAGDRASMTEKHP